MEKGSVGQAIINGAVVPVLDVITGSRETDQRTSKNHLQMGEYAYL